VKALRALLTALPCLLGTGAVFADANGDLLLAARAGEVKEMNAALESGADANATGEAGITALMYAAASGHPEAVQRLLDAHASVNTLAGPNNITALRIAVAAGSADAARHLLAAGADRDDMDVNGSRLLFAASGNGNI